MSMEDGTLRKLELYLHDLHKKIDGIYDMLMLRHERETEQKGSSAINENCSTTKISASYFKSPLVPFNAIAVWECFPTSVWGRKHTTRKRM